MTDVDGLVERLGMRQHPEGGWFVETWRAPAASGERAAGSAILYLLSAGERSHWHTFDASEVWQFSAGEAIELSIWADGGPGPVRRVRLGPDISAGDVPQAVVPAGAWQSARPLGAWALVGCIVIPAFDYDSFRLAPEGWEPPG